MGRTMSLKIESWKESIHKGFVGLPSLLIPFLIGASVSGMGVAILSMLFGMYLFEVSYSKYIEEEGRRFNIKINFLFFIIQSVFWSSFFLLIDI